MSEQANSARLIALCIVISAVAGTAVASVAGYTRGSIAVGIFSGLVGGIAGRRFFKSSNNDDTKTNR